MNWLISALLFFVANIWDAMTTWYVVHHSTLCHEGNQMISYDGRFELPNLIIKFLYLTIYFLMTELLGREKFTILNYLATFGYILLGFSNLMCLTI